MSFLVAALFALSLIYPQVVLSSDHIFQFRTLEAERITVMEGGGYWPTVALLPNGELIVIARAGAPHAVTHGGSRLQLVRSGDRGKTWSEPVWVAASRPDQDLRDGWLTQLKDGTLILGFHIYGFNSQNLPDMDHVNLYLTHSRDEGVTWDVPSQVDISPYTWGNTHGRIVELPSGTLLMHVTAAYTHAPGWANIFRPIQEREYQSYVFRSRDGGKTWGDRSLISNGNETSLLGLASGKVLAAVRGPNAVSIHQSVDEGRTWRNLGVATESGELPGSLLLLKDGRILLSYGDRRAPFFGVQAVLSRDEGQTWDRDSRFQLVWDAPNWDCGYPTSIQLPDGRILTVYYQVDDLDKAPASAKAKGVIWQLPK